MKWRKIVPALMLVAMLAACESSSDEKSDEDKQNAEREKKEIEARKAVEDYKIHLICPQVAIVRELGVIRDYGNEKPNAKQLIAAAGMQNITGTCSYHDDGIDIAFTVTFDSVRGPQFKGEKYKFPYFVAVVDPAQSILNKNEMTAAFRFSKDEKKSEHDEQMHVFIPLAKDKQSAGPNYRVLAGFQLSPAQLADAKNREVASAQTNAPNVSNAQKANR